MKTSARKKATSPKARVKSAPIPLLNPRLATAVWTLPIVGRLPKTLWLNARWLKYEPGASERILVAFEDFSAGGQPAINPNRQREQAAA